MWLITCYRVTILAQRAVSGPPGTNVQRFRGGFVFKAHGLWVSLNSRLESDEGREEVGRRMQNAAPRYLPGAYIHHGEYMSWYIHSPSWHRYLPSWRRRPSPDPLAHPVGVCYRRAVDWISKLSAFYRLGGDKTGRNNAEPVQGYLDYKKTPPPLGRP